jgi:lipopolysaccharide transport system permease protein
VQGLLLVGLGGLAVVAWRGLLWSVRDARHVYVPGGARTAVRAPWYRFLNPLGPIYNLYLHRDLLRQFTRREVEVRYRGSFLGIVWSLAAPLCMLTIYTVVFSTIFQARWRPGAPASPGEFAITLFAGLIAFNLFAECLHRAPTLVVAHPGYVRKVIFPLEILPASVLGAALFHAAIGIALLIAGQLILSGSVSATAVLLPLAALPLVFLTLGVSWFLASLGVYVRDTAHVVGMAMQVLLFLTPIFYPIDAVPGRLSAVLRLNPLFHIIDGFRRVVVWEQPLAWNAWLATTMVSGVVAILGYTWFMKTKSGFADVL